MLDNLVSNAVKFTPRGRLDLGPGLDAHDRAIVAVEDTGIGVPADEQGRLFERFSRFTAATEHAIPGTGLGLHVSALLIQAHGGTISTTSVEGRGSTFCVELDGLPVAPDPPVPAGAGSVA